MNQIMGHKLNWRPQLPDFRDYKYEHHSECKLLSVPAVVDRRRYQSPVRDQGDIGDCTAFGTSGALEELEIWELNKNFPNNEAPEVFVSGSFDPMSCAFTYAVTRIYEGTPLTEDSGAQVRDVILAIRQKGVCKESAWPTIDSNIFVSPPQSAYGLAAEHKNIYGYSVDNTNIMSLKKCLASGSGVVFGAALYSSFESQDTNTTGVVVMPSPDDQVIGGHCMFIVGYDDSSKMFIVKNSWGSSMGNMGYYFFPYDYLTNGGLATDFWTLRRVPCTLS